MCSQQLTGILGGKGGGVKMKLFAHGTPGRGVAHETRQDVARTTTAFYVTLILVEGAESRTDALARFL